MKIIVDTETTGITHLSFANKLNYKKWPRMVQIAWALLNNDQITDRQSHIIYPNGYTIPPNSTQIHGISQAKAIAEGTSIKNTLELLNADFAKSNTIIAHNLNFDLGIIESEAIRQQIQINIPEKRICTLYLARKYLTNKKYLSQNGSPKLGQFYETLFGFSYGKQHQADNDVVACYHIYKRLKQLGCNT